MGGWAWARADTRRTRGDELVSLSRDTQWQQIPPYNQNLGEDLGIRLCHRNRTSSISNRSKGYKCKFCGLPKKGHVCKMSFSFPKHPTV